MFQLNILFWHEERMGNPHPFLPLIVVPELFYYSAYKVTSALTSPALSTFPSILVVIPTHTLSYTFLLDTLYPFWVSIYSIET